jgi:putative transposase
VISDGAPGIIAACEPVLGRSLRQRRVIHKSRNVLSKISKADQQAVKDDFWKVFDTTVPELQGIKAGQQLVEAVQARIDAFVATWEKQYPAAMKSMLTDRQSLTPYLRFPTEHHRSIRHSNFIERTFGETRRRVKVIGRFPGETSCVSLVWAVLDRAARGWRGFTMTPAALHPARPAPSPPRTPDPDPTRDHHRDTGRRRRIRSTHGNPRRVIYTTPRTRPP